MQKQNRDRKLEEPLAEALLASLTPSSPTRPALVFDMNAFRRNWYTPYYFAFRQNRYITDISFGELVALLRRHIITDDELSIQFYGTKPLKYYMSSIISGFYRDVAEQSEAAPIMEEIARRFYEVFTHAVMIDSFYGSCTVVIPRGAKINLEAICGEAGYVYMCGRCIYMRRTNKCEIDKLKDNLNGYIQTIGLARNEKVPFRIYSEDLFPDSTKHLRKATQHGLADLKIDTGKYWFGGQPIYSLLQQLATDRSLTKRMDFPNDTLRGDADSFPKRTVWLATDTSANLESRFPGTTRYYVCFAQEYINKNEFYIFDERVPGWSSPITLPHSLASAMINIARPFVDPRTLDQNSRKFTFVDPFVGTGTLLFQALKFRDKLDLRCNDLNSSTRALIVANLRFFCLPLEDLIALRTQLNETYAALSRTRSALNYPGETQGVLHELIRNKSDSDTLLQAKRPKWELTGTLMSSLLIEPYRACKESCSNTDRKVRTRVLTRRSEK